MSESKHGGSRPNSGRKPLGDQPMVTCAFSIRQDQADWLDLLEDNKSESVRRALDAYVKIVAKKASRRSLTSRPESS